MKDQRTRILEAAVTVAETIPITTLSRSDIAKRANCAPSLVSWYLGAMDEVRGAVIARAIETNNAKVIAWAMASQYIGDHHRVPATLKRAALKVIAQ